MRGSETPSCLKAHTTSPEQSNASGPAAPHTNGRPILVLARARARAPTPVPADTGGASTGGVGRGTRATAAAFAAAAFAAAAFAAAACPAKVLAALVASSTIVETWTVCRAEASVEVTGGAGGVTAAGAWTGSAIAAPAGATAAS